MPGYYKKILIAGALCWTFCLSPPLRGQSPCKKSYDAAQTFASRSDFKGALAKYGAAMHCFRSNSDYYMYLLSMSYAMDCLDKLSEYDTLSPLLASLDDQIRQDAPFLSADQVNSLRFSNQLFKGLVLGKLGDVDGSLAILKPQLDSLSRIPVSQWTSEDSSRYYKVLLYCSEAYLRKGDFDKAASCAYEAVHVGEHTIGVFYSNGIILRALMALAESQFNAGQTDETWKTLHTIRKIISTIPDRRTERAISIAQSVFGIYLRLHQLDSAEVYLQQLQSLDTRHQYSAMVLSLSGDYHTAAAQPALAEKAYRHALQIILQQQGEKSETVAGMYLKLGNLFLQSQQYQQALGWFHKGEYTLSTEHSVSTDQLANPPLQTLFSQREMLSLLRGKAVSLDSLYHQHGSPRYLEAAWQTSRLAVQFMEHLRSNYSADIDKSLLIGDSYDVFEHALSLAYFYLRQSGSPQWVDSAFVLMEESKALNLRDAILHGKARKFAGIPDSLLQKEDLLLHEITGKERLVRDYRSTPGYDRTTEFQYMDALARVKERYHQLLQKYEAEYPRYYALRHQSTAVPLTDLVQSLAPGQAMLEYFVGDASIYILYSNASAQQLLRIPQSVPVEKLVRDYRTALVGYPKEKNMHSLDVFARSATALYNLLIPDLAPSDTALLIIPDGILGYVSYASLLRKYPDRLADPSSYDFLLWRYTTSYAYSANLFLELQARHTQAPGEALVCAPVFDDLEGIPALPYGKTEARRICNLTSGKLLSGPGCTVAAFRDLAGQPEYQVLHLATHGFADDTNGEYSYLLFSAKSLDSAMLYARDLYAMHLGTDLVYLSACETGTGELRRGEGIISLARAFFYAGARSLVTTLWSVDDSKSAELSGLFYDRLEHGVRKDAALAGAQRAYLQRLPATDHLAAHPVYWSALIAIGNMHPLKLIPVHRIPLLIPILTGMVLTILLALIAGRVLRRRS